MATAFSEYEKVIIKANLEEAARICLGKYGIKKTTVEEIVKMAGISKGAFYNFYSTKEILFFSVFEQFQIDLIEEMTVQVSKVEHMNESEFSELIYAIFQKVRQSFIMNIIQGQEFEQFMRKLPEKVMNNHQAIDERLVRKMFAHVKLKKNITEGVIAASLRILFMSMLHAKEIGERNFNEAFRLLISGFAEQVVGEERVDG